MPYNEYSVVDFKDLVDRARAGVDRMVSETGRQSEDLFRVAGERAFRFMVQADEMRAARAHYVASVELAAAKFLSVCDELILLQESYDVEMLQALDLAGAGDHPGSPAFDVMTSDDLLERMQGVAGQYAHDVEVIQIRFFAHQDSFTDECAALLHMFTSTVAQECNILVETLDDVIQRAQQTGEMFASAAATGVKGTAIAMVVATAVGVAAATTAVHTAGAAATAIWDYFAAPARQD